MTATMTAFEWIWRASWQASVLAVVVLLVQRGMGRRLSARAHSLLWLIVLARLVLPPLPVVRWTMFAATPPETPAAPMMATVPVGAPLESPRTAIAVPA